MLKRLLILALTLCAFPAFADTTATITWTATTQYEGGETIPSGKVVMYKVYRGPRGQAKSLITQTINTGTVVFSQPLGEQCYQVTATVDGVESRASNESCKIMRMPGPTDGSIEAPTDGSIEYLP